MEPFLDVRRAAALDMALHGDKLIVAEFAVGTLACGVLGAFALAAGLHSLSRGISFALALGLLLIGAALNYLPLLLHSVDLARKRNSKMEASDELKRPELIRRYSVRQFILLVPFAVAVMSLAQLRRLS